MRKLYFYLSLLICLVFFAKLALAQNINIDSQKIVNWIGEFLGIPREFLVTSKIFRYVMLPFLAVFVAVLGIMRDIMLFRRSRHLDWILALIISFIILPWSGFMGWLILWLYGTSGVLSVTVVGLLIGIGAIMWFIGGIRRIHYSEITLTKHMSGKIKQIEDERTRILSEWENEMHKDNPNLAKADKLRARVDALESQRKEIERRI
jgi:hypothetical protein